MEIIFKQADFGQFDDAKNTTKEITIELYKVRALGYIAEKQASFGYIDDSKSTFNTALDLLNGKIPQFGKLQAEIDRTKAMIYVSKNLSKSNDIESEKAVVKRAFSVAKNIIPERAHTEALLFIAEKKSESKEIKDKICNINKDRSSAYIYDVLKHISDKQTKEGDLNGAVITEEVAVEISIYKVKESHRLKTKYSSTNEELHPDENIGVIDNIDDEYSSENTDIYEADISDTPFDENDSIEI